MFNVRFTKYSSAIKTDNTQLENIIWKYNNLASSNKLKLKKATTMIDQSFMERFWIFLKGNLAKSIISTAILTVFCVVMFLSIGIMNRNKVLKPVSSANSFISNNSEIISSDIISDNLSKNEESSSDSSSKNSSYSTTDGSDEFFPTHYPNVASKFKNVYYTKDPSVLFKISSQDFYPLLTLSIIFGTASRVVENELGHPKNSYYPYAVNNYIQSEAPCNTLNYIIDQMRITWLCRDIVNKNNLTVSNTMYVEKLEDYHFSRDDVEYYTAVNEMYAVYTYYLNAGKVTDFNDFYRLILKESEAIYILINVEKTIERYPSYSNLAN